MVDFDVAIVGAGFAGAAAARVLSANGVRCALIDRRSRYPDLLKAEKVEADQAHILRALGLLDLRRPCAAPIGRILRVDRGVPEPVDTIEQYGVSYSGTVNSLRERLPPPCEFLLRRVQSVEPHPTRPRVRLADGGSVTARLVVLASGGSDSLAAGLGLVRQRRDDLVSLTYGFDVECSRDRMCDYAGLNFHPGPNPARVDYLTLFPIGGRFRANLFTQQRPREESVGRFKRNMQSEMSRLFSCLHDHIGHWRVAGPVQVVPTVYTRLKGTRALSGVVVIGEEFQSVSPATGMGLSKVLTDVSVLCMECIPDWLDTGTIGAAQLRRFYGAPQKRAVDRKAAAAWLYFRNQIGPEPSLLESIRQRLFVRGWSN